MCAPCNFLCGAEHCQHCWQPCRPALLGCVSSLSAGSRLDKDVESGYSSCPAQLVWCASTSWLARSHSSFGECRGVRRRQVTSNMEQLLKGGVLDSPEAALAMLLEAFSSMVFDPELVKEGRSVVRLPPLSSEGCFGFCMLR